MKSYKKINYHKVGVCLATMAMTLPALAQDQDTSDDELDDDIILLSPFEVEESSNIGYLATQTLAGTRIKTDLKDVGSAISVVTKEMLRDTGATDNQTLLSYTTNTEVGSITGNFSGFVGDDSSLDETSSLLNPSTNTRVRGLSAADNTRDYFISEIPWDSYNTERVDMQRGPNSILFGLGSPSGIINSSSNTANFDKNGGNISVRFDRWGGSRASLDYNQIILDDELAVRLDILKDNGRYRQKQAYENDRRFYITSRYAPKFLNSDKVNTQLRVSYDHGEIDANRPRTLTPTDNLTTWWDYLNQGGIDTVGANEEGGELDVDGGNYNAWYSGTFADAYGGIILSTDNGSDTYTSEEAAVYVIGGLNSKGETDNSIDGITYSSNPAIANTSTYAENAGLSGSDIGAYKNKTLSDSSIFDFYNNLLDGNTKWESQDWDAYSVNFSQNFLGNRFGYEFAYNKQEYSEAQESLLSSYNQAISVDIRKTLYDGSTNPNYGRVYVANRGAYGNNSNDITRENFRFTVTGELRGSDFFDEDSLAAHIIGKHMFTGLYSKETVTTDSRSWKLSSISDDDWSTITGTTDATGNELNLNAVIYLTDSLVDVDSYEDLYLSALSSFSFPTSSTVSYFDTTWSATGVSPSDGWDSDGDGKIDTTQSENPDNYVGWTTDTFDYTTSDTNREDLYTSASITKNKVSSKAFVWQAYLFDGLVVPTFGYREDTSENWTYTATSDENVLRDDNTIDTSSVYYTLPDEPTSIDTGNSKSFSLVVHSPDFINKHLPWGLKLSGFYNKSENFQPNAGRIDILGNDLESPTGRTTDYGFVLSALDNRVSLKVNWYKTIVENATMSSSLGNSMYFFGAIEAWGGYYARKYYYGKSLGLSEYAYDWSLYPNQYDSAEAAAAAEEACLAAWFENEVSEEFQALWNIDYDDADTDANATSGSWTTPDNLTVTCDQESRGIEFELYMQLTDNWSVTMNASKTKARRYNLGSSVEEWILARDAVFDGAAGDLRLWWIGSSTLVRDRWNTVIMSQYQLFQQLENSDSPELRPWRANLITNYYFPEGTLKGFNIGGGYRWQDKSIIGYYIDSYDEDEAEWYYDLDRPYYGKSTSAFDMWVGYGTSLTDKVDWRIQFNIRNIFGKNELVPLNVTPTIEDPTELEVASWAIAEGMNFSITNTFTF